MDRLRRRRGDEASDEWRELAPRTFNPVTITIGSMTITLHGVIIATAQESREMASLTLNYTSMEYDLGPTPSPGSSNSGE